MRVTAALGPSLAVFTVLMSAASLRAGAYSDPYVGTSSGKFLSFGTSARAAAMGEAYAAAPQDADAVRYNPAAMTRVTANSLEVMHASFLAGTFLDHGAFVRRLGPGQALGLSALQMSYGSIAETDETGYQTGTAHPADLALSGAYAREFNGPGFLNGVAAGFSATYIRSTIVSSAETFTASLALLSPAYGTSKTRLAFVAENLAGTLKFDSKADPLPMTFKLGGIACILPDLTLALDLVAPRDNAPYAAAGAEKWLTIRSGTKLAIRAGYNMRTAKDIGGLAGFAAGVGVILNAIYLDYALSPFGDLGDTHRLTLGVRFGGGGNVVGATAPPTAYREFRLTPAPEVQPLEAEVAADTAADTPAAVPEEKTYQDYLEAADNFILQKDYLNAGKEYDKARKSLAADDERKVFTFNQQAQMSLRLKNIQKAREFYLAAVTAAKRLKLHDSNAVNAYLGLAHCFDKSGKISPAVKNYEKALKLSMSDKTKTRIRKILRKLKAQAR